MKLLALINCSTCGNQVSLKASACPKCGEPPCNIEEAPQKAKKSFPVWEILICLGIPLIIGLSIFGDNSPNSLAGIEKDGKSHLENSPVQTIVQSVSQKLKRYTPSKVNIRKGPGTDFEIVSRLKPGELVEVEDKKDKWVEVYKNDKRLGYVYASLLAKNPPKRNANEQQILLKTASWGDFRKARKIKLTTSKKSVFIVWSPILQYARNTLYPRLGTWAKSPDAYIRKMHGQTKMTVLYDEVWIWEDDSSFTESEKEQYKGQLDIYKIYWLKGKVQAHIVGKLYENNPVTGTRISPPTHKIWQISDRKQIFNKL